MTSADTDPEITAVVELEMQLLDPAVRASRDAVSALLDPEFRELGTSGAVWDRDSILTAATTATDVTSPSVDHIAASRLAPDLIHLTYRTRRASRVTLRSSIWRRRHGGWRVWFHQGTVRS